MVPNNALIELGDAAQYWRRFAAYDEHPLQALSDHSRFGQGTRGAQPARPRASPRSSPTRARPTAISGRPHDPMEIHA